MSSSYEDRGAQVLAESGSMRKLAPFDRIVTLAERTSVLGLLAGFGASEALRQSGVSLLPRALASVGAASIAAKMVSVATESPLDSSGQIDKSRVSFHLGLDAILFPLAGGLALIFSQDSSLKRDGAFLLGTAAAATAVTAIALQKDHENG